MNFNVYLAVTNYFKSLKKYSGVVKMLPTLIFGSLVMSQPAFAGLQKASTALDEIKVWAYGILGILIFLYIMYHIVMALLNKMQWSDVMMSVVYSAIAGAAIVLGEWAWGIWAKDLG